MNRYIIPVIYTNDRTASVGAEVSFNSSYGKQMTASDTPLFGSSNFSPPTGMSLTPTFTPNATVNFSGGAGLASFGSTATFNPAGSLPSYGLKGTAPASPSFGIGSFFGDLGKGLGSILNSSGGQSLIGAPLAPSPKASVNKYYAAPGSSFPSGPGGTYAAPVKNNTLLFAGLGVAALAAVVLLSRNRRSA